jgi:hypothetical protein
MAHHKTTQKLNVITVKDAGNTYQASWDGLKASSTAGPEQAAKALVKKMLGHDADIEAMPKSETGKYRFQVQIQERTA